MANYPDPTPLEKRHTLAKAVHKIALALPNAWEDHPWGGVVYKVGAKIFTYVGPNTGAISVKSTLDEQRRLCALDGVRPMPCFGKHGWVTLEPEAVADLARTEQLIRVSHTLVTRPSATPRAKSPSRTRTA